VSDASSVLLNPLLSERPIFLVLLIAACVLMYSFSSGVCFLLFFL